MNKNDLKQIEYNIRNNRIGKHPKFMKEMYLNFFYQDLNQHSGEIDLFEYFFLKYDAILQKGVKKNE